MARENMSYYRSLFCLLCFLSNCSVSFSQTKRKLEALAKEAFNKGDFSASSFYYQALNDRDTNDVNTAFYLAESYLKIYKLIEAKKFYAFVLKNDEKKIFKDALFHYAQTLKMLGEYKKAKKEFEKYLRRIKKGSEESKLMVQNEIEGCALAATSTTRISSGVTKLPTCINSPSAEVSPFMDHDHFYYASRSDSDYFRIYSAQFPEFNQVDKVETLDKLSRTSNMSNLFIDDKQVYFTITKQDSNYYKSEIFSIISLGDSLQELPIKLSANINMEGSVNTQACVMNRGIEKFLIFSSNRANGVGGFDLYFSKMNGKTFEDPISISGQINSIGDEITPYFCSNCNSLFFSSNFLPGLGGYDVFKSRFIDGAFAKPVNLGAAINSSLNDLYYTESHKHSFAFLSSNRIGKNELESNMCCNDIYMLSLPKDTSKSTTFSASVAKDSIVAIQDYFMSVLPLNLYFDNDEPNPKSLQTNTDADYPSTANFYLLKKKLFVNKYSEGLTKEQMEDAQIDMKSFFEDSITGNYDRLDVMLSKLKYILGHGFKVSLLIKGYTSSLASTDYNKNLAKRRVMSLVNYLNKYDNACFKNFISSGVLQIKMLEIGEAESLDMSDNPVDQKNSVYSLNASLSRRISILKINIEP